MLIQPITNKPCPHELDFSFVHSGRCADTRDNLKQKFTKSGCAHSRAECTQHCVREPSCGFFAYKDSNCSVPGSSANCFLYGTSSGCRAGATKSLFPEFKTFQLKLGGLNLDGFNLGVLKFGELKLSGLKLGDLLIAGSLWHYGSRCSSRCQRIAMLWLWP